MPNETLEVYIAARRAEVDALLATYLPPASCAPASLHEAMRYSLFAGGKRLRPILALAACDAVLGRRDVVLPFAAALELIHTYSLVHDDLPAMDNDDLRRGRPTAHKVFGEATAILTGDALLTAAFALMAEKGLACAIAPKKILSAMLEVGVAAGSAGMVGGQMLDIAAQGKEGIALEDLHDLHLRKTGFLILAAVRMGGILGGGGPAKRAKLTQYGEAVGLAFQIVDDILDVEGETAQTGKPVGADASKAKWTYPRKVGLDAAKKEARVLIDRAVAALKSFGPEADRLREIAAFTIHRTV